MDAGRGEATGPCWDTLNDGKRRSCAGPTWSTPLRCNGHGREATIFRLSSSNLPGSVPGPRAVHSDPNSPTRGLRTGPSKLGSHRIDGRLGCPRRHACAASPIRGASTNKTCVRPCGVSLLLVLRIEQSLPPCSRTAGSIATGGKVLSDATRCRRERVAAVCEVTCISWFDAICPLTSLVPPISSNTS